jgi:hypothetical protein
MRLATRALAVLLARHEWDRVGVAVLARGIHARLDDRLRALLRARLVGRAVGVPVLWGILLVRHCVEVD